MYCRDGAPQKKGETLTSVTNVYPISVAMPNLVKTSQTDELYCNGDFCYGSFDLELSQVNNSFLFL